MGCAMDASSVLAYGLESGSGCVAYRLPMVYREDIRWLDSHRYTIEGHTLEGTDKIEN